MIRVGLFQDWVNKRTLGKFRRCGIGCEIGCGTEDPLRSNSTIFSLLLKCHPTLLRKLFKKKRKKEESRKQNPTAAFWVLLRGVSWQHGAHNTTHHCFSPESRLSSISFSSHQKNFQSFSNTTYAPTSVAAALKKSHLQFQAEWY